MQWAMTAETRPFARALVVDDEKNIRTALSLYLESLGCKVTAVASEDAALSASAQETFDLAFVDLRLQTTSGLDLIPKLLHENPSIAIVVVTAYATIETAVEAIRLGAVDYLPKPFSPAQIKHVVSRLAETATIKSRIVTLESALEAAQPYSELNTSSPKMRTALEHLWKAAESESAVLLRGESGTGKNVVARALHARSPRAERAFVTVNVGTLSDELLLSELFGHARGAFTGAVRDHAGRVEAANGGTLFLDEIGELSAIAQTRLLRFLQEKQFERLGEARTRHADVRIVAATNRDLEASVKDGRFREDLFYRLSIVDVSLPPLRERREDILSLCRHFLAFFAHAMRRPTPTLSNEAEALLTSYAWPGNVRELRNTIERALVFSSAQIITPEVFPERMQVLRAQRPEVGAAFTLEQIEREHIQRIVARAATQEEAAKILGIDATTLWRKKKRFDGHEP
jgi:NtrC-family two-component system response regulator AlgB